MKVSDFDYDLPRGFIAQEPVTPRDASRLMVLDRAGGKRSHRRFRDLPEFLRSGDLLVLNNTRVIPARLRGRWPTGGRVEALLLNRVSGNVWHALLDSPRRPLDGDTLIVDDSLRARVSDRDGSGRWTLDWSADPLPRLEELGRVPLPPYIKREVQPGDRERYQTVYAASAGAVAAPTAGLHFTPELLEEIGRRGVEVRYVTLHVGIGTFQPVKCEDVEEHRMMPERYEIPAETVAALESGSPNRRVVAVGTTTVRTLETWARTHETSGESGLFIHPPFEFRVVKALITNFHVPKSTLLMLVSAFAGRERILEAYEEAKREGYRFFSYGDAMFLE